MSNTISEGEIVIKDELPEAELIKILDWQPTKQKPITIEPEPKVKKEIVVAKKADRFVFFPVNAETKIYPCDKCGRYFKAEGYLQRHIENHETNGYTCKICGKNFKTSQYLHQHSFIHKETRDYHCDLCGKSFKSSANLSQHKYCHVTEKAFACSICGKAFRQRIVMKRHEQNHSKSEGKPACLGCGAFFEEGYVLQLHQRKCPKYINNV
jgi:uncharacterized Zn-finger protein